MSEPETLHSVHNVVGGMRVHGRVGDGALAHDGRPHIVFVHGLGMSTGYMEPTMRWLARDYAVSALDLPGFGASRHRGRALSLNELATVVLEWMRVRGIESPILVGNSLGSQIIVDCVMQAPECAVGLVLNAPTIEVDHRSVLTQLLRVVRVAPREPVSLVPQVLRNWTRAGPRRVLATLASGLADRIEEKLPRVRMPVTIVCGARDPISPPSWGEWLAARAGSAVEGGRPARFLCAEGVAHAMPFSHPELLGEEIVAMSCVLEASRLRR